MFTEQFIRMASLYSPQVSPDLYSCSINLLEIQNLYATKEQPTGLADGC